MSQNIIRTEKGRQNPFVMVDRTIFENTSLSWRAKGLLGYLLSRPDNWSINVADLANRSTDGRDSCYAALKELGEAGYITKNEKPKQAGRFGGYEYVVHENPLCVPRDVPPVEKTVSGETVSGETVYGFPDTNNKENNNKDCTNKNYIHADAFSWKPDLKELNDLLKISGLPEMTEADVNAMLPEFNLHYSDQIVGDSKRYSKLIAWIRGRQFRQQVRVKPHSNAPHVDHHDRMTDSPPPTRSNAIAQFSGLLAIAFKKAKTAHPNLTQADVIRMAKERNVDELVVLNELAGETA